MSYQGGDPANYHQASCGFDYDAIDESIARREAEAAFDRKVQTSEPLNVADALVKLIAFIIDSDDYKLRVDIIIAGSGLALCQGWSYTEMAAKHGISKQAFDKHVLKFQKDFQLPVTRAQKSPHARSVYQNTQIERQKRLEAKRQQQKGDKQWQSSLEKAPEAALVS